jgi:hypothetical protein
VFTSFSILANLGAVFVFGPTAIGLLFTVFQLVLWCLVLARRNWARVTLTVFLSFNLLCVLVAAVAAAAVAQMIVDFLPINISVGVVVAILLTGGGFTAFYLTGLNVASSRDWFTEKASTGPITLYGPPPIRHDTIPEVPPKKPFGVLIAAEGSLKGTPFVLAQRDYVIGRSGDIALPETDLKVSREHAKIRFENGAFVIYDMGSTNHTHVNGERVDRKLLQTGDQIGIGETVFRFEWVRK